MDNAQPTVGSSGRETSTTPLRTLGTLDETGCRLLHHETSVTYRDGAEEAVLRILHDAKDLRSDSAELRASAEGWAQRYHLDGSRANILRCLDLPPDARVLEVGAGCGAITRYLGERCAVVDALEPVAVRAAAARARTRDLTGVEVFVGDLDDVPELATYDVVVVVGVLEYVGRGASDRAPYLTFLDKIAQRLAEGGSLALAIENRLGVKYLAGAPEDHTDRVFDSVEGYPRGGNAHTFNRRELESLMASVGLTPTTLMAFPDYKMTRAVFGQFPQACRSLLHRIPRFPSPDWASPRPRLIDERLLWRELVDAGMEMEFANSFLVLAAKGDGPSLWPEGRAGAFYTTDRVPSLNVATTIEITDETVQFRRTALRPDAVDATKDPSQPRIVESVQPFRPGSDLTEILAAGGIDAWRGLVDDWLRLLDAALADDPESAIDVVPHNLVVGDDGDVHVIDVELSFPPISRDRLIRRGVFYLAERVAPLAPPERWAPARTVGDVMRALGEPAGLPADGSWIEQTVVEEAELQRNVPAGAPVDETQQDEWRKNFESWLRRPVTIRLADLPLGDRRLPKPAAWRRVASRLLPVGTGRRQLVERLRGR